MNQHGINFEASLPYRIEYVGGDSDAGWRKGSHITYPPTKMTLVRV